jgi:putative ABC transport system permease protein
VGLGRGRLKFLPLIWAMLWRSKTRTWLTFLSIVVAFLLFGLLQSVTGAFEAGVRLAADDQLMVTYRQGLTKLLPTSYLSRIQRIDGVALADGNMWVGGWFRDQKNQIATIAVSHETFPQFDDRILIAEDQLQAFRTTRMGAVAGRELAQKNGWKIGDRIPLNSSPKKDGSTVWEFQLVGLMDLDDRRVGQHVPMMNLYVRFDYYDELTPWPGHVVWYAVRVKDPKRASAVAKAIDREFANSELETRTQTMAEFQRGFLKQFGDVGLIMSSILGAVFFTLLLVAGNTMMQAYRERVPELAVLKTLGFTDRRVAALVLAESLLLCGFAAAIGMVLAAVAIPMIRDAMAQFLAGLTLENLTLAAAAVLALALGMLAALVPAWRSARLSVIEALAVK